MADQKASRGRHRLPSRSPSRHQHRSRSLNSALRNNNTNPVASTSNPAVSIARDRSSLPLSNPGNIYGTTTVNHEAKVQLGNTYHTHNNVYYVSRRQNSAPIVPATAPAPSSNAAIHFAGAAVGGMAMAAGLSAWSSISARPESKPTLTTSSNEAFRSEPIDAHSAKDICPDDSSSAAQTAFEMHQTTSRSPNPSQYQPSESAQARMNTQDHRVIETVSAEQRRHQKTDISISGYTQSPALDSAWNRAVGIKEVDPVHPLRGSNDSQSAKSSQTRHSRPEIRGSRYERSYPNTKNNDDVQRPDRAILDLSPRERRLSRNEHFLPEDGIDREVIQSEITRLLGNDVSMKPGVHNVRDTRGYIVRAYRGLTAAMIRDLKDDSAEFADWKKSQHLLHKNLNADAVSYKTFIEQRPSYGQGYSSYRSIAERKRTQREIAIDDRLSRGSEDDDDNDNDDSRNASRKERPNYPDDRTRPYYLYDPTRTYASDYPRGSYYPDDYNGSRRYGDSREGADQAGAEQPRDQQRQVRRPGRDSKLDNSDPRDVYGGYFPRPDFFPTG